MSIIYMDLCGEIKAHERSKIATGNVIFSDFGSDQRGKSSRCFFRL